MAAAAVFVSPSTSCFDVLMLMAFYGLIKMTAVAIFYLHDTSGFELCVGHVIVNLCFEFHENRSINGRVMLFCSFRKNGGGTNLDSASTC